MEFRPTYIKTREPARLATTTITNELADAFNMAMGLGDMGGLPVGLARSVVLTATIDSVYQNRVGFYRAKSLTEPKPFDPSSRTAISLEDVGKEADAYDVILTYPAEILGASPLSKGSIVSFVLLGETAAGNWYGQIIAPSNDGGIFPVRVTQDGGSAGNSTTQCSFTYTVKDKSNKITLATNVAISGNGQRVVNATMTAGTWGMAFWDDDKTLKLLWVDERITQEECE